MVEAAARSGPDVRLMVGGRRYGGWTSVQIQRGIEQIAGQFSLSVTDRWAGHDQRRAIRPGDRCTVTVDGETVITGHVDDVAPEYDGKNHSITVRGRDATGDLVDCSAQEIQWKGRTLLEVATEQCRSFGISVRDDAGATEPFQTLQTEPGETVFEALETAARIRGVLLVSDGRGGLVITRAGTRRAPGRLELGVNILRARATFSHRDRFSQYTVKGQSDGNSFDTAGEAFQIEASAADAQITRHRPLILLAEGPVTRADAKTRATWQRNIRAGRSSQVEYTLHGWRDEAGTLWQPNRNIHVVDPYVGVDRSLLIVSVALTVDEQGVNTSMTMMLREAFELLELPEPKMDGSDEIF